MFLRKSFTAFLKLQIVLDVHLRQVCTDDGHPVVVFPRFVTASLLDGVSLCVKLENAAHVGADSLDVLVDDDDLSLVLTQHVAEVVVGRREGATQDDNLVGSHHQLGGVIPGVDITLGDDGLQLQGRKERRDGSQLLRLPRIMSNLPRNSRNTRKACAVMGFTLKYQ